MRFRRLPAWLLLLPLLCWAEGPEFWLSPAGNDAGPGTKPQPFATLERAREAVRKARGAAVEAPAVVHLLPGVYLRNKSFELAAKDGGAVTYRAEGAAVLRAGTVIPVTALRLVTDPQVLARMDVAARGKAYEMDLRSAGIRNVRKFPDHFSGGGGLCELYWNGRRLPLSRWPNETDATMAQVLDRGDEAAKTGHGGVFVAREDRVARWNVTAGVWVEGYWRVPWSPTALRVSSIDPTTRAITLAVPIGGGIGSKYAKGTALGDGKEPWWAVNLLEEIDIPGEWCVDFQAQKLYLWPPSSPAEASFSVADMEAPMVVAQGVNRLVFEGLAFEQGLGSAIEIRGGEDVLVAGCAFRSLGGNGVVIRGGVRNGVLSSDFHDLGEGGILLSGGDRTKLTPCGNFAENNHLHHLGIRKKTYAAGIQVGAYGTGPAVGCRVTHNYIHDLPHAGILYGGNDNVFEFNEICRVVLTSADMGAFYTANDWTSFGNVVRHNFVHSSPRANGFYMDDGDSGDVIEGNVCHGFSYGPFIGGGHDNVVRHNLIIACERGLHLDARGLSRGYDKDRGLLGGLASVPYRQSPWSERYPALPGVLDRHPEKPFGNRVTENAVVACGQPFHFAKAKDLADSRTDGNVAFRLDEAGFTDPSRADFSLRKESAIFVRIPGFPAIPFAEIGLRRDAHRTALPERVFGPAPRTAGGVFDSDVDVQRTNQSR
jgi:hypothetical protein